jgi:cytochrome c-type biogenesis protein CcsB
MTSVEGILLWGSIFGYFLAFISYLVWAVFKKDGFLPRGWRLFVASLALQTLTILWRWYERGSVPVMVSYEHYQLSSWFIGIATLILGVLYNRSRALAMFTLPVLMLMLGIGVGTQSEMIPLSPPYKSNWLFVHIGFAWFAWGCFVVAAVTAAFYLVKRPGRSSWFMDRVPDRGILDELMMRLILFGFVCQGLMIAAGAIWAHQLWGRYWGWDPIETWSLICWLVYGVILHLRLMLGWRGARMAVIVILALLSAMVYIWGMGFGPASHTRLME